VPRGDVRLGWLEELRSIEQEVREINRSRKHGFGANEGYNVGISVVDGGSHGNTSNNISGSIHSACLIKERPELWNRIVQCFKEILGEIYGSQGWYKRLLLITTQLNQQTNEHRTIPGLPLSGLWLTEKQNEESDHCDKNVVGATFLLTTSDVKGPTLCMSSPTGFLAKYDLKPGAILAGSWANHSHCNLKADENPGNSRTSWTLNLDERVFCKRYEYVRPEVL
jgi:hypothetical protein